MQYKKGNSSLTIDFENYDQLVKDAQKKRYQIKQNEDLQSNENITKIDLPKLRDNAFWIILVERLYLPISLRTKEHQYAIKFMLGIKRDKNMITKTGVAEFRLLDDTNNTFNKDEIIKRIVDSSKTISGSFLHSDVQKDVNVKSNNITYGENTFIESKFSKGMSREQVEYKIAELYSVFKDRHIKSFNEKNVEKGSKISTSGKNTMNASSDADLFESFLKILEISQTVRIDGISYQRNFPVMQLMKIIDAKNKNEISESFAEKYISETFDSSEGIKFQINENSLLNSSMDYDYSIFPFAKNTSDEKIKDIQALNNSFSSILDFMNW